MGILQNRKKFLHVSAMKSLGMAALCALAHSAYAQTYSVSGTISPSSSGSGTLVSLGSAAPTLVQSATGSNSSGSSSATVAFGSNAMAGDAIVVFVRFGGTSISSVTDNQPGGANTYTSVVGPTQWGVAPNSTDRWAQVFVAKKVTGGAKLTITVKLAAGSTKAIYVAAVEYSGVDPVNPVNATAAGTGTTSSNGAPATSNLTTTVANTKLVATSWDANESYTASGNGAGYTTNTAAGITSITGGSGWPNLTEDSTAASAGTSRATASSSPAVSDWAIQVVALAPAPAQTATADASGNYTFSNVNSGSYIATPSKSGVIFSPTSQSVTVNTTNVTGVNFTAGSSTPQTYSVSGAISPSSSGSGATVSLGGAAPALVQTATGSNSTGNSFATISFGSNATAGDAIVVFARFGGTSISSVTDNQPGGANTYTSVVGPTQWGVAPNPTDRWSQVFVAKKVTGGAKLTITVSFAGSSTHDIYLAAMEYSGVDPVNPVNATAAGTGTTSSNGAPTTSTLTTTVANTKLVATSWDANESYTASGNGAGYTTNTAAGIASISGGSGWSNLTEDSTAGAAGTWKATASSAPAVSDWAIQVVALAPAPAQTTTADASGMYAFSNVNSGSYIVSPSKPGITFSPASQSVTVTSTDVSGVNFTAASSTPPTYSISGTISPSSSGSGTKLSLGGAAPALVQTATGSNSTGNSFATISFGSPSTTGDVIIVFARFGGPTISSVTDNQPSSANIYNSVVGPTQWGVAPNSTDRWAQVFVAKNITGGLKLTITVKLAGSSTHDIYLAAMEYSGVDPVNPVNATAVGTGTVSNNGAPTTSTLTTTVANAKLVATSWDSNESYTASGNGAGYTTNTAAGMSSLSGGSGWPNLTEDKTAPNVGTWNATASSAPAVVDWAIQVVALAPVAAQTTTADANGNYTFSNVNSGNYIVSPSKSGTTFSPTSQSVTVTTGNVSGVNFSATSSTGTFTGKVTNAAGTGIGGASVSYSGGSTTTASDGTYTLANVPAGTYSLTVSATSYNTLVQSVTASSGVTTTTNFSLTVQKGNVSGVVKNSSGNPVSGATVKFVGGVLPTTTSVTTNPQGKYSISGIPVGNYVVTVTNGSSSTQKSVAVTSNNTSTLNFTL